MGCGIVELRARAKFKNRKNLPWSMTLKLVFHHPPTTRKLFLIPMDSRANSKTFLKMGNFFKTLALKRYRQFNFGNLLIRRLWIDMNLSKSYPNFFFELLYWYQTWNLHLASRASFHFSYLLKFTYWLTKCNSKGLTFDIQQT